MRTTQITLLTACAPFLLHLAGAAENLTIAPAHRLPDYAKSVAASETRERVFVVGFAVGDFNEDGRKDFVIQTGIPTGNFLPFGAQTFLQETNGTFRKGVEQLLPNTGLTWDLVPGDYNEDGHLDILMEDSDHDMVMLPGNGDGTFQPARFLGLGAAGFFAVADLNGDTHLDIVAGKLDGRVGVFTGNGQGSFSLSATLDTIIKASYPRFGEIQLGDLNGDGKIDVAVASVLNNSTYQAGNLDVFLGNGDGTFQGVVRTTGVATRRCVLGDFNGDGVLDYAGNRGSPEQLEIWRGSGNGRFTRTSVVALGTMFNFAYGMKVGDVNHDGIRDIIVGGQRSNTVYAAPLSIFPGLGHGAFGPRVAFTAANGALPLNTGPQLLDFDGDGLLDVLTIAWISEVPIAEALTMALSQGANRDPRQGFLVRVQNDAPGSSAPVALESSTNLTDWVGLATNTAATATWSIVDPRAGSPHRFYRTRRP